MRELSRASKSFDDGCHDPFLRRRRLSVTSKMSGKETVAALLSLSVAIGCDHGIFGATLFRRRQRYQIALSDALYLMELLHTTQVTAAQLEELVRANRLFAESFHPATRGASASDNNKIKFHQQVGAQDKRTSRRDSSELGRRMRDEAIVASVLDPALRLLASSQAGLPRPISGSGPPPLPSARSCQLDWCMGSKDTPLTASDLVSRDPQLYDGL